MSNSKTAAIVLAAGLGTRMKSNLPKVLHPIAGRAMILQLLDSLSAINPEKTILVVGPDMEPVSDAVSAAGFDVEIVVQRAHDGVTDGGVCFALRALLARFDKALPSLGSACGILEALDREVGVGAVVGFDEFEAYGGGVEALCCQVGEGVHGALGLGHLLAVDFEEAWVEPVVGEVVCAGEAA